MLRKLFPNRHWHEWADVPGMVEVVAIGGWPELRQMQTCECEEIHFKYTKMDLQEIIRILNAHRSST